MQKRSLYQCFHAKVGGKFIYCEKEHPIHNAGIIKDNMLPIQHLQKGNPLEFSICQNCEDYLELGLPLPKSERGWI